MPQIAATRGTQDCSLAASGTDCSTTYVTRCAKKICSSSSRLCCLSASCYHCGYPQRMRQAFLLCAALGRCCVEAKCPSAMSEGGSPC